MSWHPYASYLMSVWLYYMLWVTTEVPKEPKNFDDKNVAIVGGAPSMVSLNTGEIIDNHDVVIRINMPRKSLGLYGGKVDYCFLGANVQNEYYLDELFRSLQYEVKILTTTKNKGKLSRFEKRNEIVYYPASTPSKVIDFLSSFLKRDLKSEIGGVPRSGLVCILVIYFLAKPKKITIFAMSDDATMARTTIDRTGELIRYDENKLLECHCSPEIEIALMEELINKTAFDEIEWVK